MDEALPSPWLKFCPLEWVSLSYMNTHDGFFYILFDVETDLTSCRFRSQINGSFIKRTLFIFYLSYLTLKRAHAHYFHLKK